MRRSLVLLPLLALFAVAVPRASAATWSQVASNTSEDITAVEYQSADRFWFATGGGKVFRRAGGTFVQVASVPGTVFKDIEFQGGGGLVGFAVGTNGTVLRSADGGATWTPVALTGGRQTGVNNCSDPSQAIGDAESIRFAGDARAWIVAGGSQIYRTVDGATAGDVGSAPAGWQWINNNGGTCKIDQDIDDLFTFPGSNSVTFISKEFGKVFFSSDALATPATPKTGDAGNGFQKTRRVAGDPDNPNRQWTLQPYGEGGSYYSRTTDGWSTELSWNLGNPDRGSLTVGESLDFAGGTVLAAGSAGEILESVDGGTFYLDPAAGLTTEDWKAVSLASGSDGAVGGAGGKLVVSANANTVPDVVAPTGVIAGPTRVTAGQPAVFTANLADEVGGSGVNPASVAFTATGTPGGATNPVTLTFPSVGFYTVRATFRDNAGNAGEASLAVQAVAAVVPPPVKPLSKTVTKTATVPGGGTISLGVPRACIPVGSTFKATLGFRRSKKKGAKAVKVSSVAFTVDGKKKTTDKKAPFVKTISVKALKAGSKHKLNARATIKVKKGKSPKKSVFATFTVCG